MQHQCKQEARIAILEERQKILDPLVKDIQHIKRLMWIAMGFVCFALVNHFGLFEIVKRLFKI